MTKLLVSTKAGDCEVAVAQLVKQSLLIPEFHGSNPVIGKIYIEHLCNVNYIEKTENKEKRGSE